jgi:hypothetical protein
VRVLLDENIPHDLRVIDESGEDYVFSADRFVAIEVPGARQGQPAKALACLTRDRSIHSSKRNPSFISS